MKRVFWLSMQRTPISRCTASLILAAGSLAVAISFSGRVAPAGAQRIEAQSQNAATAASQSFEVASIKPDKDASGMFRYGWFSPTRFTATGVAVKFLILDAFRLQDEQVSGAPQWTSSERYDIEAKIEDSVNAELDKLSLDESDGRRRRMVQNLLIDRFKLAFHHETKELPAYVLVIGKNGPKLHQATPGDAYPNGIKDLKGQGHGDVMRIMRGVVIGQGIGVSALVNVLSWQQLGRIVVDNTALTGKYDFTLRWTPDDSPSRMFGTTQDSDQEATARASSGPSLFTALQEQLGLKLEPRKAPVEILVIDHVERPSPN